MYASVVTTKIKPGALDGAVNIYRSSIVPAVQTQPGFKGATFLVNTVSNIGVSTIYWESEARMLAAEASGYIQNELAKLGQLLTAPPANTHYEVVFQL